MSRQQLGVLLLIGAVLLAGTCALIFGPARGARNDIGHVRTDLDASRDGIFNTLETGRQTLAESKALLRLAEQSLVLQEQGLTIAHDAAGDTDAIRLQTTQALQTVREVLAALGPLDELKGTIDTVVRNVQAGVALARTALSVAQETLSTGRQGLEVARRTLHELQVSRAIQQQLLLVARQTLAQATEINRKIPGVPIFPAAPAR